MRHGRQSRLAEVGARGQERLARSRVTLACDGLAGIVEARYLAGAGVGALSGPDAALAEARRADASVRTEIAPARVAQEPAELAGLDASAREVARGALAALRALRGALDGADG